MIPHSRPTLGEEEAEAARRVVLSGQLAQGREVAAFEEEVAGFIGRRYGVAVASGTAALHLGLLALGIGTGDRVLMPSYVCTALLHATWSLGARPVLADIDLATRNLDPGGAARRAGLVRAVILPHMFGLPAAVEEFLRLGVPLIEDCAMSIGAEKDGRKAGSTGELAICSFYATKVLCAGGEGGMVLTDSAELAERVRTLREYDGLPADRLRFNYKMTDLAAAIGRVQLRRVGEFVARRRALAALYQQVLREVAVDRPPNGQGHIYHRFVIRLPGRADELIEALERRQITARHPVFRPLHRELGEPDAAYPNTATAHAGDVSLPLYPTLKDAEALAVAGAVREALAMELRPG
ncbi:MAG: DegT/DnrJ/EryC1/StrS aminotransferase family protein [Candidatus Latescibacteria bacterium]|nr:DegT/DnrJ/EryC1/StrS aminotransferase family protein [Candidatus Latescibacterota bacterium]